MDGMEPMDEHERLREKQERLLYKLSVIETSHQAVHDTVNDPEVTTVFALGYQDMLLLGLALAVVTLQYPCLYAVSESLQLRILEVVQVQQPDLGWGDGTSGL